MKKVLEEYRRLYRKIVRANAVEKIVTNGISGDYLELQRGVFFQAAYSAEISRGRIQPNPTSEALNEVLFSMPVEKKHEWIKEVMSVSDPEALDLLEEATEHTMSQRDILLTIGIIDKCVNHLYGNEIGQYLLNMKQILKFIRRLKEENQNLADELLSVFRAQFSRFELAIIGYHCIGDDAQKETNSLIDEFEIFQNLYLDDLCFKKGFFELFTEKNLLLASKA